MSHSFIDFPRTPRESPLSLFLSLIQALMIGGIQEGVWGGSRLGKGVED